METNNYIPSNWKKRQIEADQQKAKEYTNAFMVSIVVMPLLYVFVVLYLLVF